MGGYHESFTTFSTRQEKYYNSPGDPDFSLGLSKKLTVNKCSSYYMYLNCAANITLVSDKHQRYF